MMKNCDSNCPLTRALALIGEKWTPLILRELFAKGPRRNLDLQNALTGISANTLSDRLKKLQDQGIIQRRFYSEHPPRAEYELTKKGKALGPTMKALKDWGKTHT